MNKRNPHLILSHFEKCHKSFQFMFQQVSVLGSILRSVMKKHLRQQYKDVYRTTSLRFPNYFFTKFGILKIKHNKFVFYILLLKLLVKMRFLFWLKILGVHFLNFTFIFLLQLNVLKPVTKKAALYDKLNLSFHIRN